MSTMMLVSSEAALAEAVSTAVHSIDGFELERVHDVDQACLLIGRKDILVVLYHLKEGSCVSGVSRLLQTIAIKKAPVTTLVVSDVHRGDQGLAMLRLGVADYLSRPLDLNRLAYLIDFLTLTARHGLGHGREPAGGAAFAVEEAGADPGPVLVSGPERQLLESTGAEMGRMIDQVKRIAALETTILLEGETGTGKTHLANVIHRLSPRREKPFLVVNCGALSTSLIESEIFGHLRGAFTGAESDRVGKFTEVGRGTLFLDELDSLPLPVQAKLLRAVEERVFEPVGSNRSQRLQARLVVASNRPLEQEVAAGRFRADLFYRLNVIAFMLPPLRERAASIPALAHGFLREFAARDQRQIKEISAEAIRGLLRHAWPGNIRELRNVIERAVALCDGPVIELDDLPASFPRPSAADSLLPARPAAVPSSLAGGERAHATGSTPLARSKSQAEIGVIAAALKRHDGNRVRTAAELGISRKTLYQKLNKYGLMGSV